jgi:Protein NO VEIN, C-terminal
LEAKSGKSTLRIEVKGLSGSAFAVELTPNEYDAFKANAADYRLAVVLEALGRKSLQLCRYSDEKRRWVIDSAAAKAVKVQERVGAAIKCV